MGLMVVRLPVVPLPYTHTTYEEGPSGFCETSYEIIPHEQDWVSLTKVRDLTTCQDMPYWRKSLFQARVCPDCDRDGKRVELVRPSSQIRYTLHGGVIYSAIGESKVVVTPFSPQFTGIQTHMNQTMFLLEIKAFSNMPKTSVAYRPIQLPLDYPNLQFDPINLRNSTPPQVPPVSVYLLEEYIVLAAEETLNIYTETAFRRMSMFIEMMRTVDKTVVAQIYDKYMAPEPSTDRQRLIRSMLWNYLPIIGTRPIVVTLTDKCIALKDSRECKVALAILSLTAEPSTDNLQAILDMLPANRTVDYLKLPYLTLGSLAYKRLEAEKYEYNKYLQQLHHLEEVLQSEKDQKSRSQIHSKIDELKHKQQTNYKEGNEILAKVIEALLNLLRSPGVDSKILAIKSIGNSGIYLSLFEELSKIFLDKSQPEILRLHAVYALRRMTYFHPEEVRERVFPLVIDIQEKTSIRIASFDILRKTGPERTTLQYLSQRLRWEKNLQVSSYIYTYLEQMSNTTQPCWSSLKSNATYALGTAKRVDNGIEFTRYRSVSTYNDYLNMGATLNWMKIASPQALIPDAGALTLYANVFGYYGQFFQVGYGGKGLQKVMDRLFGVNGILINRSSIFDLLKRAQKRVGSPIDDIFQQLSVVERELPDPEAIAFFAMFENELTYYNGTQVLQDFIQTGQFETSFDEAKWKPGYHFNTTYNIGLGDSELILPTDSGFPVTVRLTTHTMLNAEGFGQIDVDPSIFLSNRNQQAPITATINLNTTPRGLLGLYTYLKADACLLQSGVSTYMTLKSQLPVNLTLQANLTRNQVVYAALRPPWNEVPVVQAETTPNTFLYLRPYNETVPPEIDNARDLEIADRSRIQPISVHFGRETLGMAVSLEGQIAKQVDLQSPPCPFTGKQSLDLFIRQGADPPNILELQTKCLYEPSLPYYPLPANFSECDNLGSRLSLCLLPFGDKDDKSEPRIVPPPVPVYPNILNLLEYDVSLNEIRTKVNSVTDKHISWVGAKWGMVTVVTAHGPTKPRAAQLDLYWRSQNWDSKQDFAARLYRTPIPGYDTSPWQLTLASTFESPEYRLPPEQLLNTSYQLTQQRGIQEIVKEYSHRPVLKWINDSVATLINRQYNTRQYAPINLINSLSAENLYRGQTRFIQRTRYHMQHLRPLSQRVHAHYEKVKNPYILLHSKNLTLDIASEWQLLQNDLTVVFQDMVDLGHNATIDEVAVYQYALLTHLQIMNKLGGITAQTEQLKVYWHLELANIVKPTIAVAMNLTNATTITTQAMKPIRPSIPPSSTFPLHVQAMLDNMLNEQMAVLGKLLDQLDSFSQPNFNPILEMIDQILINTTYIYRSLLSQPVIDMAVAERFLLVAIQNLQLIEGYYTWFYGYGNDHFHSKLSYMEFQLNQIATMGTSFAGILFKAGSEVFAVQPIMRPPELKVLHQLYVLEMQHNMVNQELEKINYNLRNATLYVHSDTQVPIQQLYKQLKTQVGVLVALNDSITIAISSIRLEPNPKLIVVTKLYEAIARQSENANFIRYIRTSFSANDRKEVYQEIETLLSNCEMLKGQLSHLFYQIWLDADIKPSPANLYPEIPSMKMDVQVKYGVPISPTPPSVKTIDIKVKAIKSLDQMLYEYLQMDPLFRTPSMDNYLLSALSGSGNVTLYDNQLFEDINTYGHVHLTAKYKYSDFTPTVKKWLGITREYIKYRLYNHSAYELPPVPSTPDELQLIAEVKALKRSMDLYITTPEEVNNFYSLAIPEKYPPLYPVTNTYTSKTQLLKDYSVEHLPGTCTSANYTIGTFDKVEYQLPNTSTCQYVMAMDCSPQKSFYVTLRGHLGSLYSKSIILWGEDTTIEILREPNYLKLLVNKINYPLNIHTPYVLLRTVSYNTTIVAIKIVKTDTFAWVELPRLGVNLYTDGYKVSVEVSAVYRGKTCGLCSNFDGQMAGEFQAPWGTYFDNPLDFVASYNLTCKTPKILSSRGSEGSCNCKNRTAVFFPKRKSTIVCFSIEPVQECSQGYEVDKKKSVTKVPFHCMKKTQQTMKWVYDLKSYKIDEVPLEDKNVHRYRRIRPVEECKLKQ